MDATNPRHPIESAVMSKRLEETLHLNPAEVDDLATLWMYELFKKHYFGSKLFFTQPPFDPRNPAQAFLPPIFMVQQLESTTRRLREPTPDFSNRLQNLVEILGGTTLSLRAIARSILQQTLGHRDQKRVMYEVMITSDRTKKPGRIIHPKIYRTRND